MSAPAARSHPGRKANSDIVMGVTGSQLGPAMKTRCLAALFPILLAATARAEEEIREFMDVTGRPLMATYLTRDGDNVELKLANGTTVTVPLVQLSEADRQYIDTRAAKSSDIAQAINEALGLPAFTSEGLARRDAEEIAKAMKLPQESEAPVGKSWRLYAAVRVPGYKLFGAVPYSVALYSNAEGKTESLSIIFANKGDYGSKVGFGRDHFRTTGEAGEPSSLAEAMKRDRDRIEQSLGAALGEGQRQRFGDSGTRRSVRRWDWNDHSFLLSHEEGEYVSVLVVPTSQADAGGRTARVSDAEIRARLQASLRREDNGDVWISGIPMVDQGPKGYCVPATFERAMRYMGVEADMYLLAMVGETAAGGGTSVNQLMDNLRSQVYRKGRRLKETSVKTLRIRDVKRQIDSGIPLLWRMCSMEQYNDVADKNTSLRRKGGHAEWLARTRAQFAKLPKPESNHHLCMIIGYNENTGELAVSDSWGARFELRWVPVEVADWANNGTLVMIQP
jgi:hypothetical protein